MCVLSECVIAMCYIVSLKAGHQNIQGGGSSKLAHKDLVNKVKAHHLFGAQETKLGKENEAPDIEGYVKFRSDRSKRVSVNRVVHLYMSKNQWQGE